MATTVESAESRSNYSLPSGTTLQHCAKLAIVEDKPIMFDYWTSSCDKDVLIGVRENEEKLWKNKPADIEMEIHEIVDPNEKIKYSGFMKRRDCRLR